MRLTTKRSPLGSVYLGAQIIAGIGILGVVTTGRAALLVADELTQSARRELAKLGGWR